MQTNTNSCNNDVLNDETLLGIFDTDGTVLIEVNDNLARGRTGKPCSIRVRYGLEQSTSKSDLVIKFAKGFGGITTNSGKAVFRCAYNSPVGDKVRDFLKRNPPRHPGRFNDYLIAEEVITLLNKEDQKSNLIVLLTLAYNTTIARYTRKIYNKESRSKTLDEWIKLINPTDSELKQSTLAANTILARVQAQVDTLTLQLPTMKLSDNYIRGALLHMKKRWWFYSRFTLEFE